MAEVLETLSPALETKMELLVWFGRVNQWMEKSLSFFAFEMNKIFLKVYVKGGVLTAYILLFISVLLFFQFISPTFNRNNVSKRLMAYFFLFRVVIDQILNLKFSI